MAGVELEVSLLLTPEPKRSSMSSTLSSDVDDMDWEGGFVFASFDETAGDSFSTVEGCAVESSVFLGEACSGTPAIGSSTSMASGP